jgi:hypothetical protein
MRGVGPDDARLQMRCHRAVSYLALSSIECPPATFPPRGLPRLHQTISSCAALSLAKVRYKFADVLAVLKA